MNRSSSVETSLEVCQYIETCRQYVAEAKQSLATGHPGSREATVSTLRSLNSSLEALVRSRELLMRTPRQSSLKGNRFTPEESGTDSLTRARSSLTCEGFSMIPRTTLPCRSQQTQWSVEESH
ncbi:hypothetical protein AWB76_01550 [Caballeronia temeraria]|uniref:Uncharacterized protein n=1 Tax=Caballeronia temeraria TaxID=1777137 RepID=A0A158A2V7_9BURK|nr:hypothetical protein AWB76_01550 [Caballeronia temeraria]